MSLELKECGKIFTNADFRLYICCFYCRESFTQLAKFLEHIQKFHYEDVLETKQTSGTMALLTENTVQEEDNTEIVAENQTTEAAADNNSDNEYFDVEYIIEEEEEQEKKNEHIDVTQKVESVSITTATNSSGVDALTFDTTEETVMIDFIESLHSFECLWDIDSGDYKRRSSCQAALRTLGDTFNLEVITVQKSINYLKNWCKQQKKSNEQTEQTAKYMKLCEFLYPRLKRGVFKCPFCSKTFSLKKYLDVHKQRHLVELPFQCYMCPKRAATSTEIATHLRVHTNERPYSCRYCGETFKTSSSLCVHERKHGEPTIQCSLCPKAFYTNYQLRNHINIHLNVRNYKCKSCDKSFTTAKALYSHNTNVHTKKDKNKSDIDVG